MIIKQNTIVTLTGCSGGGKSTLARYLVSTGKYTEIVSTTTRPPRANEKNGVQYHFVTEDEFKELDLLESIEYNGTLYGATVQEFARRFESGAIPVIVVEPNGMHQINERAEQLGWKVVNVFIDCPLEIQNERFLRRVCDDYRAVLAGGLDDYDKFMNQYVGRLTAMREGERDWQSLFEQWCIPSYAVSVHQYTPEDADAVHDVIEIAVRRAAAGEMKDKSRK